MGWRPGGSGGTRVAWVEPGWLGWLGSHAAVPPRSVLSVWISIYIQEVVRARAHGMRSRPAPCHFHAVLPLVVRWRTVRPL